MTLSPGTRLGTYEIVSSLGAGGMGEVYRARDPKLNRTVAIKVLSRSLANDTDALARFEREAHAVAALSHPNILSIFDFGDHDGVAYAVTELLEGETLRERLAGGALPQRRAVEFATQIARGLAAAHEKGIVHRDLKPENLFVTKDGHVKILDFGLAKLTPAPGDDATSAPTQKRQTEPGTVMGTVGYMSPEQVRGQPVDGRSDIFSFGSILYEMLSGKRAFTGASAVETMNAILTGEPENLSRRDLSLPESFERLVHHCLEKKPEERFQSVRDLAFDLETLSSYSTPGRARAILQFGSAGRWFRTAWLPWLLTATAAGIAVAMALRAAKPQGEPARVIRFAMPPPAKCTFGYRLQTFLAVSPDGSRIAFVARDTGNQSRIFLRPLSALEALPLSGTEGATSLFWSPDSRSIAYFSGGKLSRLDLAGGTPVTICDVPIGGGKSGTWGQDGEILFSLAQGDAIQRVRSTGGTPVPALRLDRAREEVRIQYPWFLPDGERFLYIARRKGGVGTLMLSEPGKPPRALMPMASAVQYADPGYLVFAREGALLGQRFDWRRGRLEGGPFSIAEHVRYFLSSGGAEFALSRSGTLVHQSQNQVMRMIWVDRTGREIGTLGPLGIYDSVAIAPDGKRVLFVRARTDIGTFDIWAADLARGTETRITSETDSEFAPVWLPGGKSFAYSANRGGTPQLIRRDLATDQEEEILPARGFQIAQDVSPDGRTLIYSERLESGRFDVFSLPLSGGKPVPLLPSSASKNDVRFSPDGRFLAFISEESGQPEVYVTSFPGPGEKTRVSTGGAQSLRWSRAGQELLYISGDRHLMSVPVRTTPTLEIGTPTALFALTGKTWIRFDVSPDGKRFLPVEPMVVADELPLEVTVNWTADVPR